MDNHTPEQRRKNMQAVKNKDSKIELLLRKALWNNGIRYRKNVKTIFGHPDIAIKGKKIAVFCDSEFWHGFDWEHRKDEIKTRRDFWIPKIERNTILLVMRSLPLETEIKLIDYLLSDYKADGETVGFLLVMSCGMRIIESSAAVFGNIIPLAFHPGCYKLLIYETGTALSEFLKSGGKSRNASRAIPLFDRVLQFLEKRKEYVKEQLRKQEVDADVDTLPIACSGKNYLAGCTTKQISDKAREIFTKFGVKPKVFQFIDAEMANGHLQEIREKNPTGYLGRHIFATHLAVCDLTESETQAVIGHEIEDSHVTRNDFSNDEVLFKIKEKMDRFPLYRTEARKACVSDIDFSLSGNGSLNLQINQPVKYIQISAEN